MTSIQLTVGEKTTGAFVFVGDSSDNNGMSNPVCAKVSLGAGRTLGHVLRTRGTASRPAALTVATHCHTRRRPLAVHTPVQNLDLPANQAVSLECSGVGKYVTLATPKNLTICDIYIQVCLQRLCTRGSARFGCPTPMERCGAAKHRALPPPVLQLYFICDS